MIDLHWIGKLSSGLLPRTMFLIFAFLTPLAAGTAYYTLTFDRSDLTIQKKGMYDVIRFEDAISTGDVGSPELPTLGLSLLLPPHVTVTGIRITNTEKEPVEGRFLIHPAQKPTIPGEIVSIAGIDESIYSLDRLYPSQSVRLSTTGTMSGYNIMTALVYPVQYIPRDSLLFFNTEISFAVDYVPDSAHTSRPLRRYARSQNYVDRMVGEIIFNIDALPLHKSDIELESPTTPFVPKESPSSEGSAVDYLIVTNDLMKPAFEQLANWKTAKGVPAVVTTLSEVMATTRNGADNAETLRNFITDAYERWGVMWVLLGGDVSVIPARYVEVAQGERPPSVISIMQV